MVYYFFNPDRKRTRAILSMSAKEIGKFQITFFTFSEQQHMFIPWSDSIMDDIRSCLRRLDNDGYQREKFIRFDLYQSPDDFEPTRIIPLTRSERITIRALKALGIE